MVTGCRDCGFASQRGAFAGGSIRSHGKNNQGSSCANKFSRGRSHPFRGARGHSRRSLAAVDKPVPLRAIRVIVIPRDEIDMVAGNIIIVPRVLKSIAHIRQVKQGSLISFGIVATRLSSQLLLVI